MSDACVLDTYPWLHLIEDTGRIPRTAQRLIGGLQGEVPLLPNPIRHAGFVVLRAADVPSVLVEMGFMSNPADEAALRRAEHRARVAGAYRWALRWQSARPSAPPGSSGLERANKYSPVRHAAGPPVVASPSDGSTGLEPEARRI